MGIELIIFLILLFMGLGFFFYSRSKKKKEPKVEGKSLPIVIANLEAQGKVQGDDFEVFIISETEYENSSDSMLKEWFLSRFGLHERNGNFTPYTYKGRGLHEFQYVTENKRYYILLLIVDKTSKPIINPTEPIEPQPQLPVEPTEKPSLVSNIEFKDVSYNALTITWEKAKEATNYQVFRRRVGKDGWDINPLIGDVNTFDDFGLLPDEPYEYLIRAHNKFGFSETGLKRTYTTLPVNPVHSFTDFTIQEWADPTIIPHDPIETLEIVYIKLDPNPEVDNTVSLQNQLNAIPDGTEQRPIRVKFPKGRYWAEGDLANNWRGQAGVTAITMKENWILEGYSEEDYTVFYTKAPAVPFDASIQADNTQSDRRHFWFINCYNIKIRFLRVEGSDIYPGRLLGTEHNPPYWKGGGDGGAISNKYPAYHDVWEAEHAFAFHECRYCLIEKCSVYGVWGDGIYLGNGYPDGSQHITVRDMLIEFVGRQGFAVSQGSNILFERVYVIDTRRAAGDLEPHAKWLKANFIKIRNCKLHAMQTVLAAVGSGDVSNIIFEKNEYSGGLSVMCFDSEELKTRSNWIFRNNVRTDIFGSPIAQIVFQNMENIIFENNIDRTDKWQGQTVARFDDCTNVKFNSNDVGEAKFIELWNTKNYQIENNSKELLHQIK